MKNIPVVIFLILVFSCKAQVDDLIHDGVSLASVIDSLNIDKSQVSVLIDKSEFRLYIQSKGIVLKEYPVVFGKNTVDDKLMQGDQCTPEGKFKIITKYPHSNWSKFIWINYPNEDSWKKHNAAKSQGKIPRNARIGGEVGIHGVPKGMDFLIDAGHNWTLGCISLKNKDVDEIYPYITETTIIEIRK